MLLLTPEQTKTFEAVTKPVIKWLNDNGHPHTSIIIDTTRAELSESACVIFTEEYLKD